MRVSRRIITLILLMALLQLNAQNSIKSDTLKTENKFKIKQFIIPTALIAYGTISLNSDMLHKVDEEFKEDVQKNNKYRFDTYMLFVPAVSVYVLNPLSKNFHHEMFYYQVQNKE
jgi:hypothetical protein